MNSRRLKWTQPQLKQSKLTQWASQKAPAPDSYRISMNLNTLGRPFIYSASSSVPSSKGSMFTPMRRWMVIPSLFLRTATCGTVEHTCQGRFLVLVGSLRSDDHPWISHFSRATNRSARCNEICICISLYVHIFTYIYIYGDKHNQDLMVLGKCKPRSAMAHSPFISQFRIAGNLDNLVY